MERKHTGAASAFITTILVTLVLVGGTLLILRRTGIFDTKKVPDAADTPNASQDVFVPDEAQNQTVLYVLGDGESERGVMILLTRFMPSENKLYIVPVPNTMICQVGTERASVYEFYRRGGEISVRKAVSEALNIPIEKYLYLNNADFAEAADVIFGGVRFGISSDVIYENQTLGEDIVIRSGTSSLSGNQVRQLMGFPNYTEEYRTQQLGLIFTNMVNQSMGDRLYNSVDDSFSLVINKASTNVSAADFTFRREAILNMIVPDTAPAQTKIPSGEWGEDDSFIPSVEFRNELAELFKVTPLVELAE